jgi:hypothetical protein
VNLCTLVEIGEGLAYCPVCGRRVSLPSRAIAKAKRECLQRADCLHLGEPTGRLKRIRGGCPSHRTAIYECELHGECSPLAETTAAWVVACRGCGDYWAG